MGLTHSSHSKRAHVVKELERFTKPTGLYPSCAWEDKAVRKLILDGKLAPRFAGLEDKHNGTKECPICFLRHVVLNRTSCCRHPLCTECYLQIHQPKGGSPCPYCNHAKLQILCGTDDEEKQAAQEIANIRHYDLLTASPQSIPVVAFSSSSSSSKEQAQEAWAVSTQAPSGSTAATATVAAAPVVAAAAAAPCAASGSGCVDENSRSESTSPTNATVTTASSSNSSRSNNNSSYVGAIPYATVKERNHIEEEMRRQHLSPTSEAEGAEDTTAAAAAAAAAALLGSGLFSFRGAARRCDAGAGVGGRGVGGGRGGGRGGGGGGRRAVAQAQAQAQEHFMMRRALLESFGVPAHLQQVEDLMLMEAIQRSLEETGGGGGGGEEGGGGGGGGGEEGQQQRQEGKREEAKEEGGGVGGDGKAGVAGGNEV